MVGAKSFAEKYRKETNRLRNLHGKVNGCDLGVTYASSHREAGQLDNDSLKVGGFVIHNFCPSFYDKGEHIVGTVKSVHTSAFADLEDLPVLKAPDWNDPEFVTSMPRHWHSLHANSYYQTFILEQGAKHGKYRKFKRPLPYYETAFRKGMKFVSSEGKYYLMGILERKGYQFGNVYPCQVLVDDIEEAIHGGVQVTFGALPNFKNIKYLKDVKILYDEYAKREKKKRTRNFSDDSKFLLEDFTVRFG